MIKKTIDKIMKSIKNAEICPKDIKDDYVIELEDFEPKCKYGNGPAVCEECRDMAFKLLLDSIKDKVIETNIEDGGSLNE